jgi:hypothetical protein
LSILTIFTPLSPNKSIFPISPFTIFFLTCPTYLIWYAFCYAYSIIGISESSTFTSLSRYIIILLIITI